MPKKPPQHPRKRACKELEQNGCPICGRADKLIAWLRRRNIEWEDLNKERAKIEDERNRYRILRDAASEASLRRDADCLAIRTERDKVIDEMNNLIVKYNLPVLLRGSCGRSRSGAGGERKG